MIANQTHPADCLDRSTALRRLVRQVPPYAADLDLPGDCASSASVGIVLRPSLAGGSIRPLENGSISVHAHLADEEISGVLAARHKCRPCAGVVHNRDYRGPRALRGPLLG